jgi:phage minor structural protein
VIKIFGKTDTNFSTNGDVVLLPAKAKVKKEDNGDYYTEIECSPDYADYIKNGNIVVCPTPTGNQAFRFSNPQITRNKIKVKAKHVYYDSENYLIKDSNVVDKNCNQALEHLNAATDNESPFTTLSNVTSINSFRCVRKSLKEAVSTVLERWGGHLVRDNFSIAIKSSIGADNGVTIRYGKNLENIQKTEDWNNVVTKILPVGKDGTLLDEEYLYSNIQYDLPYTKTVSFTQEIEQEDNESDDAYQYRLKQNLKQQATAYLAENCVPKINYIVKANIEKITDIGDTIEVIDETLGINLTTHVTAFEYDCILEKFSQVEFGNIKEKLSSLMSNVQSSTSKQITERDQELAVKLSEELSAAADKIWGALGNSYCIYEGNQILIVDKLPKEEATNVMRINSAGIGFSTTGINGTFTSAWTIDGTLNLQAINVINLVADLIKGGTLKLGSNLNEYGQIKIYNEANTLIGKFDKDGVILYGTNGTYLVMNPVVGFAGYDSDGNLTFWVSEDEFHMKKSVVEEEITLCGKVRFIPITLYDTDGTTVINDGIGLVSTN